METTTRTIAHPAIHDRPATPAIATAAPAEPHQRPHRTDPDRRTGSPDTALRHLHVVESSPWPSRSQPDERERGQDQLAWGRSAITAVVAAIRLRRDRGRRRRFGAAPHPGPEFIHARPLR